MAWSDPFLSNVQKFEGFNPKAYWDNKQWSIGFGTRANSPNETIDRNAGMQRLLSELDQARGYVSQRFPSLNPNQTEALSSFTYNLGPAWMKSSNLAAALDKGDWQTAAKTMQQYVNANGQPLQGLANRRQWEAQHFLSPYEAAPQQAKDPMSFFDPELLRKALEMQNAPPQQMPDAAQTQPHIMTSALAMPQPQDQPTMAPAQPVMPPMQMPQPEQKPMGFLDRLSAALNQPMTQQGLGLFLAASQGADLNKGMSAGMDRASAAIKNQEMQRQAQLRDMREAFLKGMMNQPPTWAQNLPPGLMQILPMLGADKSSEVLGNFFLNQETNALNRRKTEAQIAQMENDNVSPFDPDKGLFDKKSGRIIREPQNPGNKKFTDTAMEEAAKRYSKLSAEADASTGLSFDLSRLGQLNKSIGDAGKFADWKVAAAPWAKTFGIDLGNVDDMQSFNDIVTKLAPRMRPEGSGATSDYEMRQYLASLPQLSRSPEARQRVIDAMQDGINFGRDRAAIAKDILGGKLTRDAGEAKIEELVKSYDAKAASRLKANGFKTSDAAPNMPMQSAPMSPDQQMAAHIAGNNQFPDHAKALQERVATSAQQNKSMQVGATKQVHGQWFRKTEAGWEPIANPSHQRTPTFSEALQSPDMWKTAMRGIPPLSVLVGK